MRDILQYDLQNPLRSSRVFCACEKFFRLTSTSARVIMSLTGARSSIRRRTIATPEIEIPVGWTLIEVMEGIRATERFPDERQPFQLQDCKMDHLLGRPPLVDHPVHHSIHMIRCRAIKVQRADPLHILIRSVHIYPAFSGMSCTIRGNNHLRCPGDPAHAESTLSTMRK
ncbi:hypothetical protein BS47DRAFT_1148866 [Hydnum rufescens UP504]|uniref:Uncharacterized protein n=1 Tax=Hydnum rufescens UP504 TaxID=1448309 RepID=A0A9P6E1G5_9AGAM|nr:hypothetical protein BS47DRAFT_1148866 [Hydnum rufescens UP504]